MVWVDAKLDDNVLKVVISDYGRSVLKKMSTPEPDDASALLNGLYNWSNDATNFVVRSLGARPFV